MSKREPAIHRLALTAIFLFPFVAFLLPVAGTFAQGKGNGGGGGGNGGETSIEYQIVPLSHPDPAFDAYPVAINNAGLIVGHVNEPLSNQSIASCWIIDQAGGSVTSTVHELIGGDKASDVNNLGEVVGWRSIGEGDLRAVYWATRNATPLDLLPVGDDPESLAEAINADGVVCGSSLRFIYGPNPDDPEGDPILYDWQSRAVLWNVVDGAVVSRIELPQPPNSDSHRLGAVAINDHDANGVAQVVGFEAAVDYDEHGIAHDVSSAALVWNVTLNADGSLTALPPVILHPNATAEDVSSTGRICGEIAPEAVVWDNTTPQFLDISATIRIGRQRRSIDSARAMAINTDGRIAGAASSGLSRRAVVWPSSDQAIVLLDDFLDKRSRFAHLDEAFDVNDAGHIVGYGTDGELGYAAGFVAIPK